MQKIKRIDKIALIMVMILITINYLVFRAYGDFVFVSGWFSICLFVDHIPDWIDSFFDDIQRKLEYELRRLDCPLDHLRPLDPENRKKLELRKENLRRKIRFYS